MAPRKGSTKREATITLGGIRKSRRISIHADDNVSYESGQHLKQAQPAKSDEEKTGNCHILTLPNECLLMIFSYLSIHDLIELDDCSYRFRELINVAAKKYYCQHDLVLGDDTSHRQDEAMLKRFGRFVQGIKLKNIQEPDQVYEDTLNHWLKGCTSLKRLTLEKTSIKSEWESARILAKLEHLTLTRCVCLYVYNYGVIMQACKKLKSITISGNSGTGLAFREILSYVTALKRIESITLHMVCGFVDSILFDDEVAERIVQLKQLKSLDICVARLQCYNSRADSLRYSHKKFIISLSDCESLEELRFRVPYTNPDDDIAIALDQFPKLKSCNISMYTLLRYGIEFSEYNVSRFMNTIKKFDVEEKCLDNFFVILKLKRKN